MKDILLDIINNDTSYNKSATRYLHRSHPELWSWVVSSTQFLSTNAKPKQRIWHLINNVNEIPKCPIEGIELKWWENRYLITSSRTAKQKYKWSKGDYANAHTEESNKKRKDSNKKAVQAGRKYRSPDTYSEQQKEKTKQTWINKYGVDNPSKAKEVKEKIYLKAVERGCTPRENRSARRLYYDAVWQVTEENWKLYFDKINPQRLDRSSNALDHIYSIQQGFKDSIPPYIIGHWTNLRIISLVENSIKGMRCDKTPAELFEDFFNNI